MTSRTRTVLKEEWKCIPDNFPYEASTDGNIRNSSTGKVLKPVKVGPKRKQYLAVHVGGGRCSYKKAIHRLILSTFLGPAPTGALACHKNDNTNDNRIENLYWGTHRSNTKDQIRNGTFFFAKGETNGNSKYTNELVSNIKDEYIGKRGQQTFLAKKYGTSVSYVNLVVNGKIRT